MLAMEADRANLESEEEGEDNVASEFLGGVAFDADGHPMRQLGSDMHGAKLGERPEKCRTSSSSSTSSPT